MKKIRIEPLALDQQRIYFWDVICGYCGDKPGMPVCFLAGRMDRLSDSEKADVIAYVTEHVGEVKKTFQTKGAFDVLDHRRHLAERRSANPSG